jgi:hypothetical protein
VKEDSGADPSQAQLREGAENTYGFSAKEWAALSPKTKAAQIKAYANNPDTPYMSAGTIKEVDSAATSATDTLPSPAKAAKGDPKTDVSPYEQLAQSLAQQYITEQAQLQPGISGAATAGLEGEAVAGSTQQLADLLGSKGTAQLNQADPLAGNVAQASNAEANEVAEGTVNMANAIANTGKANTETLEAAPWEQILTELASETAYKAASGGGAAAFGATTQNTPEFLQKILGNLGLPVSSTAATALPGTPNSTPTKAAKTSTTNTGTETDNASSTGNN